MYFSFLFGTNSTKRSEDDKNSSARFAYNCLGYLIILVLSIERKSQIRLFDKFRMDEDKSELAMPQNDQNEEMSLERRFTTYNKINSSFEENDQGLPISDDESENHSIHEQPLVRNSSDQIPEQREVRCWRFAKFLRNSVSFWFRN